jgi:hypothetical protein
LTLQTSSWSILQVHVAFTQKTSVSLSLARSALDPLVAFLCPSSLQT